MQIDENGLAARGEARAVKGAGMAYMCLAAEDASERGGEVAAKAVSVDLNALEKLSCGNQARARHRGGLLKEFSQWSTCHLGPDLNG